MKMQSLFELVTPRPDVLAGALKESDFAADLAQVLTQTAPPEYGDARTFFANTHPTAGLRHVLANVCSRLSGRGHAASAIFRLDTQYGGGKTHALIALLHAARGMPAMDDVADIAEFVDPALLPTTPVRVAAFDGENADPINGRPLEADLVAYTPWGELAYALAGREGYERVRASDHARVAPGAETLRALFGGAPTLILLDELSIYLRKVRGRTDADQLTPFLTGLFKAVESAPGAALVFTLAVGKHGKATDAYADENTWVASRLDEAESVAARKATLLDPTAEHEVAQVLRRRLFSKIDDAGAGQVLAAYQRLWHDQASRLPPAAAAGIHGDPGAELRRGYPFHPALMSALTDKLSTLANFQRVRGMLRLLTQAVALLWKQRPAGTYAIHLHHLDPGHGPIRNEIVTRLGMGAFDPAIRNDVAGDSTQAERALAQGLDERDYAGLPPYGSFVARAVLWHSFAFNDHLKGLSHEELRFALLAPAIEPSFVDDARQKFVASSAFLDDRPNVPLRFQTEANLTMIIRRLKDQVDKDDARAELQSRIKAIFGGDSKAALALTPFPAGPYDVDDGVGDGRPQLVVLSYDAATVRGDQLRIPDLVDRLFRSRGQAKGAGDQHGLRNLQNNLVFLVADEALKEDMKDKMLLRLALELAIDPGRMKDLAEHQQAKLRELHKRSEMEVAVAIQQCYRHLFFPTKNLRLEGAGIDLGHTAFDVAAASEKPGAGQSRVLAALAEHQKLTRPTDPPLAAAYIRDKTPLKLRALSTEELRNEFRKDPNLPILLSDSSFIELIRKGIDDGLYVYQHGQLLYGPGDAAAEIKIDANALVMTVAMAKEKGKWPRPKPPEPPDDNNVVDDGDEKNSNGGDAGGGSTGDTGTTGKTGSGGTNKPPPPPTPSALTAEAPLREALTILWEKARAKKVARLASLRIRVFEPSDGFKMLGAINTVQGAKKHVAISANYEHNGATLELEFRGTPEEATPIKEFLDPQLRAAATSTCESTFELTFTDGLELAGDAPEKLAERLARFASGAAHVEARAEVLP